MNERGLREGFYHLTMAGVAGVVRAILVAEGGKSSGVGERGGIYDGQYGFDPVRGLVTYSGTVFMPPHKQNATGHVTGDESLTYEYSGVSSVPNPVARYSVSIMGKALDCAMHLVAPLPERRPEAMSAQDALAGIYHLEFADDVGLPQAVVVLRDGRAVGAGFDQQTYAGTYADSSGDLTLELTIKLPAKHAIVPEIKAGPAGSSVTFSAHGKSADVTDLSAKILGVAANLRLRRLRLFG